MHPYLSLEDSFASSFHSPIIIALDYDNEAQTMQLVQKLNPQLCRLKVGKELFTACGPKIVEKLIVSGFDVFLDLKFHDIPNTVYKACKVAANLGVWMLNVHASGGEEMLGMAHQAIAESTHKPLLIAVTVLTSMNQDHLAKISINKPLEQQVIDLAIMSHSCGLAGVVCSAHEASIIKKHTVPSFLTITPGIRIENTTIDDQKRTMSPLLAMQNGVDYLVIGRPITQAQDPAAVLYNIVTDLKNNQVTV